MASLVPFFQIFLEKQWSQNHPQYLSELSRALFPTTFLEIAEYTLSDLGDLSIWLARCLKLFSK